ncbi:MAG: DUF2946 family protein [Rhodoferax sp.]|uniref:DUF2946 family protein n=1 Tax=Rhodoferax sp. TaxID=50421 RepID=UPI001B5B03A1|nr:DUF2946 family protein [Rhodoferax sp.]MBP9907555.1 DUF2946 family protein [Rhodoferax sp.]
MDDIVKQAMAKWPHVPACFGWLGLDARGNWYMRDDRAQALGAFDSGVPGSKGALLQHGKLIDFIGRNYSCDALGQWFFQNGPQRVYVELEATPLVWRVQPDLQVRDHIGRDATVHAAWLDQHGYLYLDSDLGFGLVHSQDVGLAADALERGDWPLQELHREDLAKQFAYQKSPTSLNNV